MIAAHAQSQTQKEVEDMSHDRGAPAHTEAYADRTPNRLAQETSPYLLQHAYNPVNWYPWGDEAFEAARAQGKPIFLSIGYSTCYWCHVMERESFEDDATAAYLNEHFIPIKVDREERPDVDDIYMTATQMMTGHGGWPMSVFLDPVSLKPFLAGTYFPPEPRHGMASFVQVLEAVTQAWDQRRGELVEQADKVAAAVTQRLESKLAPQLLSDEQVRRGVQQLLSTYDAQFGGFGSAPKFPQPVFLELLMGAGKHNAKAVEAVSHTLEKMATGGMYDQLGGGFHRYSTDGQWIVPHFEKMLYDNGQLLSVYSNEWQRNNSPLFEKVVRETVAYVLREMRDEQGGFYSAQDAEVDAREGLSYLWTADEVKQALTAAGLGDDIEYALDIFGVSRGTNFTDPHFPGDGPKNVLVLTDSDVAPVAERLQRVQQAMLEFRGKRKQPHLDDKILAGWNGLMIAGLADAGRVFSEKAYVDAAVQAANFVLEHMQDEHHALLRVSRNGSARIPAFLEDYAFVIHGLLALHRATDDAKWLEHAQRLMKEADALFLDPAGGYFETRVGQRDLFVRSKSFYDGAVPSGNGMMANNLIDLHTRTRNAAYLDRAGEVLRAASQQLALGPSTCSLSTLALYELLQSRVSRPPDSVGLHPADNASDPTSVVTSMIENAALAGDSASASFDVVIRIADGYHINAHLPGMNELVGLNITAVDSEGEPITLDIDYPQGSPLDESTDLGKRVRVHHGMLRIPVRVEAVSNVTVTVRLQACSDVACLAPQELNNGPIMFTSP